MRFRFKGLNEYTRKLERLANVFVMEDAVKEALKAGADVVADQTRSALNGIPVDNRRFVPDKRAGILQVQKDGLMNSFGVTPSQKKGNMIDMKTGVNKGTNKIGQPNVTIARRLESGTSYMKKYPVFSRATRSARDGCLKAMEQSLNESIEKIMR